MWCRRCTKTTNNVHIRFVLCINHGRYSKLIYLVGITTIQNYYQRIRIPGFYSSTMYSHIIQESTNAQRRIFLDILQKILNCWSIVRQIFMLILNGNMIYYLLAMPQFTSHSDEYQYGAVGSSLKLPCDHTGLPKPIVTWLKNDTVNSWSQNLSLILPNLF